MPPYGLTDEEYALSESYRDPRQKANNDAYNASHPDGAIGSIGDFWNIVSGTKSNNQFSAEQSAVARQFEADEAQKQRDWEERMSNTAYQRAVADMRAAGINPATLSGLSSSGSAASTPSGSAASGHAASASGNTGFAAVIGSIISAVVGGALIGSRMKASKVTKNVMKFPGT